MLITDKIVSKETGNPKSKDNIRTTSFEFAALFHSPNRRSKKLGNFKPNLFFDQMESFLFWLSSSNNLETPRNPMIPLDLGLQDPWTPIRALGLLFFRICNVESRMI